MEASDFLADLRYLGPGGEVWTEVTTGAAASARKRSYVARDSQNRMWLFGGREAGTSAEVGAAISGVSESTEGAYVVCACAGHVILSWRCFRAFIQYFNPCQHRPRTAA